MVSMCSLYGCDYETTDHLFLQCNFAIKMWIWLGIVFLYQLTLALSYLFSISVREDGVL